MRPETLGALRMAATLTHGTGLRARLREGERVLLDIRATGPGEEWGVPGLPVISPCDFRRAVGELHQGVSPTCLALPTLIGADPEVEIGVPPCGASFPGGLYRVPHRGGQIWFWAVALDAATAFELGTDIVEGADAALEEVDAMGIREDDVTGVSLAVVRTAAAPGSASEAAVRDLIESLLGRWTTHRLLRAAGALDPNSSIADA